MLCIAGEDLLHLVAGINGEDTKTIATIQNGNRTESGQAVWKSINIK